MTTPASLGRIPSPPDDRDFGLVDLATPLDVAAAAVAISGANVHVKAWIRLATPLIEGITPAPTPPPPLSGDVVYADPDPPLDQGQFGTCVGNGCAQFLNTDPINDHDDETVARAIYHEATCLDGSCDDTYQTGATVRSGMKALANRGRIAAYARAATVTDCAAWLRTKGSLVIGSDWMNDMFTPDAAGFVRPTGALAGGHCYLLIGVSADGQVFTFLNSWGDWGPLHGHFKMTVTDFASLLTNGGEAWAAVELPL